jgi:hypothetical protein
MIVHIFLMIVCFDIALKICPSEITNDWHHELEEADMEG